MSWDALLDALEERNRSLAAALADRTREPRLADIPLQADGPLPPALVLRVRVLLADTERLQDEVRRRGGPARITAAYASH